MSLRSPEHKCNLFLTIQLVLDMEYTKEIQVEAMINWVLRSPKTGAQWQMLMH